jgi:hypothetical protein
MGWKMANTFIQLDDTPVEYTGQAGQFTRVNGTQDGLLFSRIALDDLSDVTTSGAYTPFGGQILQYYSSTNTWRPIDNDPYSTGSGLNKNGMVISVTAPIDSGLVANANGVFIEDIANVAGTYGNDTVIPSFTVNSKGQITGITTFEANVQTAYNLEADYVANIFGTPGQITVSGAQGKESNVTLNLVATGVTASVYGNSTHIPQITVDTYGRIQNVDMVEIDPGNINFNDANVSINDVTTAAFRDIVISGMTPVQTTVVADRPDDVLTLQAGGGINITSDAALDRLTFSANVSYFTSTIDLVDFRDVDATGIQNGDVLVWNSSTNKFEPGTVSGGSSNIEFTAFSVEQLAPSGLGSLTYDNAGKYTFTPAAPQTLSLNNSSNVLSISSGNTVDFTNVLGAVLTPTGVTAGTYGNKQNVLTVTVDSAGRISNVSTVTNYSNVDVESYISGGVGINFSNGDIDLADSGVTAGTYGSATTVSRVTVDTKGRITSAAEVPIAGLSNATTIERFKINYAPNGSLANAVNITGGIQSVEVTSATGGEVTIRFDPAFHRFPPASVTFFGYDYTNNKYWVVPLDSSVGLRELPGGGVSGDPTLFNGNSTVEIRLRMREAETGASRGGFGTATHAWVQFVI